MNKIEKIKQDRYNKNKKRQKFFLHFNDSPAVEDGDYTPVTEASAVTWNSHMAEGGATKIEVNSSAGAIPAGTFIGNNHRRSSSRTNGTV